MWFGRADFLGSLFCRCFSQSVSPETHVIYLLGTGNCARHGLIMVIMRHIVSPRPKGMYSLVRQVNMKLINACVYVFIHVHTAYILKGTEWGGLTLIRGIRDQIRKTFLSCRVLRENGRLKTRVTNIVNLTVFVFVFFLILQGKITYFLLLVGCFSVN